MRIVVGVDGSPRGLSGARFVAQLPLSTAVEGVIASIAIQPVLIGAGEIDLIVVGARGIGGFRGLTLGSVSRAVSKAAPCSTLVVAQRAGASE